MKIKGEKSAKRYILVDLVFTFFPMIVIAFLRLITLTKENLFFRSDWSFFSLVLFGQTILKLVNILISKKNTINPSFFICLMMLILLFGFFPAAVYLVLIEIQQGNKIVFTLQIVWLLISVIIYWIIGSSAIIMSQKKITENDFYN